MNSVIKTWAGVAAANDTSSSTVVIRLVFIIQRISED